MGYLSHLSSTLIPVTSQASYRLQSLFFKQKIGDKEADVVLHVL